MSATEVRVDVASPDEIFVVLSGEGYTLGAGLNEDQATALAKELLEAVALLQQVRIQGGE